MPEIPASDCLACNDLRLLYVGIAPRAPSAGSISETTLWHRLRNHYAGNAEMSTLRMTLLELLRMGDRGAYMSEEFKTERGRTC